MPRKRATKAQNKRAKPKLKDDDGDDGMSAIQREAKRNGYLEDCDVTVENIKQKYDAELKVLECLIDKKFAQIRLKLSQAQRQMTLEEFILSQFEELEDEDRDRPTVLCSIQPTAVQNTHKSAVSDTLSKYRSKRAIEPIIEEGSSTNTVTRKTRGRKKGGQGVTFNAEPTPLSTSHGSFITPAMTRNTSVQSWNTPLVTPKFDPRLPITPAQRRNAKPGEIAISLAGSPLNIEADKKSLAVNRKGKTLQIQIPDEYEDILDNFDIPDNIDLENNSEDNVVKKMMNMFAMIMKGGESEQHQ